MIIATAHAIAERQGVQVISVDADNQSVTVRIRGSKIEALGLIAELRQLTTNWFRHKFDGDELWGSSGQ
ncbi:MAG: hypothetical protein ACF8PN_14230 [Phycisphaerales bacterium]